MTQTRSENASWLSAPDDFFVDGLVAVLKRLKRWNRDGKSFRQLNKHWHLEITKRVNCIRIKPNSKLKPDDYPSLLNFSRLTALDMLYLINRLDSENQAFPIMFGILKRLSHLKKLKIGAAEVSKLDRNDIQGLEIEELTIIGSTSSHDLFKLSGLPLKSLDVFKFESPALNLFLRSIPSLTHLRFASFSLDACDELNRLDRVQLRYMGRKLDALSAMTSIVSLHLMLPVTYDFTHLQVLPKLKELSFWVHSNEAFTEAFKRLMAQLTRLDLNAGTCVSALKRGIFETASRLESLTLNSWQFEGDVFLHRALRRLRALKLPCCMCTSPDIAWNETTSLTSVRFSACNACQRLSVPFLKHLTLCSMLTELHVFLKPSQIKDSLHAIRDLERLGAIEIVVPQTSEESVTLEDFEALGRFPMLYRVGIGGISDYGTRIELGRLQSVPSLINADVIVIKDQSFVAFD